MAFKITSGTTHGLVDTAQFIESLEEFVASLPADWQDLFDSKRDVLITRAPGRIDLMGGIADYSGSLVLQLPIQNATHVALQRGDDTLLRVASLASVAGEPHRVFEIDLRELPTDYVEASALFAAVQSNHWAGYVAGAFVVLKRERGVSLEKGVRILIHSTVPEGKGVSSSAALEVAVMQGVSAGYGFNISPEELALLCQKVENSIVGAPCGVMDQMTAACGETNCLLELLCQPAELSGMVPLPDELEVWGVDSGIRHSVGGSDYRTVRVAAFMGYRIVAELVGLKIGHGGRDGHVYIDDSKWKGYLANITPEEFERECARHIPECMSGWEFLDQYEGINDPATSVDPTTNYPVRQATRHPIYEHARVTTFASMLKNWHGLEQASALGKLMFQSHESYSACGLASRGTDELVRLMKQSRDAGLYGARITGGGSGGAVAILGRRGAGKAVQEILMQYQHETGYQPALITGSSPGASAFGHLRVKQN